MSDPIELVNKADPSDTVAWACGKCGTVVGHRDQALAHCAPKLCECGSECDRFYTACRGCMDKRARERLQAKVAKATEVSPADYDGPVYWEQYDEYYPDPETAFEAVADEVICDTEARQETVLWACTKAHLVLDHEDVISAALEAGEHHEGAYESLPKDAYEMLRVFLDEWNNRWGSAVESWFPDTTRRVMIPAEWWAEYDKDLCDD